MATTIDEIMIRFVGDTRSFDRALFHFRSNLVGMGRDVSLMATAVTGAFAGMTSAIVSAAGSLEQTNIAFTTILKSGALANKMLKDLAEFARITPFNIAELEDQARVLMAMGFTAREVIPTLETMGNIVSGLGITGGRLQRVIFNLGQVRTQSLLTSRDLRDFAVNGIPLLDALAKTVDGVSDNLATARQQIRGMITGREISFEDVMVAMEYLGGQGGTFGDLLKSQSETFFGVLSNIGDSLTILARQLGEILLPAAKKAAEALKEFIDFLIDLSPSTKKAIVVISALITVIGGIGVTALTAGGMMLTLGTVVIPLLIKGYTQLAIAAGAANLAMSGVSFTPLTGAGRAGAAIGAGARAAGRAAAGAVSNPLVLAGAAAAYYAPEAGRNYMDAFGGGSVETIDYSSQASNNLQLANAMLLKEEEFQAAQQGTVEEQIAEHQRLIKLYNDEATLQDNIRKTLIAEGETSQSQISHHERTRDVAIAYGQALAANLEKLQQMGTANEEHMLAATELLAKINQEGERLSLGMDKEEYAVHLALQSDITDEMQDELLIAYTALEIERDRVKAAEEQKRLAEERRNLYEAEYKTLRDQLATATMSQEQQNIYRILTMDIGEAERAQLLIMQRRLDMTKKAVALAEKFNSTMDDLMLQAVALERGQAAADAMRMRMDGMTNAQIRAVLEAQNYISALERAKEIHSDILGIMSRASDKAFHISDVGKVYGTNLTANIPNRPASFGMRARVRPAGAPPTMIPNDETSSALITQPIVGAVNDAANAVRQNPTVAVTYVETII